MMGYLEEVLEKCGVSLSRNDETSNVFTQEQSLVIRDIEKCLIENQKEKNIHSFVKDLKSLFEDRTCFQSALLPSVLKRNDEEDIVGTRQESLMRVLLGVDDLQSEIIEILLAEITRSASECNEEDASFLKLCLNTLRYLPYIKDSGKVTETILDVLDISMFETQLEILNLVPSIIPDSQCDKTARELSKLLGDNSELTPAIVDCLNCLNLSGESKLEIEYRLIDCLTDVNAINNFVVLYEFLTKNSTKDSLCGVLGKCRDALGEILLSNDAESESKKVIIVNKLNKSVFSKNIYEAYINFLTKITEHRPIDILLLVILHSSVCSKKQKMEVLFKKHVKNNVLKLNQLESFYQKYLTKFLIKDYLSSFIELAACLLKDNETIEFSTAMHKLMFESKKMNGTQRQDVIHNLIMLTGFWEIKNISQILKVLTALSNNAETMRPYANQLMLLLDKLDVYELGDVKTIFDILCSLVCGDENYSGLKSELHILIRKQLSMSKIFLKQRGIIGAVIMVKHILITDSVSSADVQESIKLLELTESSCGKSTDLMGLFYDRLANIVACANLDKNFIKWLHEKITNDFQDKYVVETVPPSIHNMELVSKYSLNITEEIDSIIYVNIAELSIKNDHMTSVYSIQILAPFFRLLRLLHFKENSGDLSTIDALLGCGVILPKTENLDVYSIDELKHVADSLYHCVNWFREIISAFVVQQQRKIRRKVLQRLQNLVEIEKLLDETMEQIPEHKLPTSYFYSTNSNDSKKVTHKKPPKKKQKLNDTVSTTLNETTAKVGFSKKTKKPQIKINFRDLDTDIMILFKYPLKLSSGDLEQSSQLQTQQTTIRVSSFDFLLKDLAGKLDTLTKNKKDLSLMNIGAVDPAHIITDCVKLLPNIYNKFQVISKKIKVTVEETEQVYDHQSLFTDDINELKVTFCSVLNCFNLIFNWVGFRDPKNLKLLRDCLKGLKLSLDSSQLQSTNQLSREFAVELSGYTEECLNLSSAVNLIQIMQGLYVVNSNNVDIKKKIALAGSKLLSRPWFDSKGDLEKGKESLMQLDILIQSYLGGANVKTLGGLIATLQNQVETLKSKEDNLDMLKSVNKASFHVLYRNFCICLLERIKVEIVSLTNNEHLNLWKTTSLSLQGLMTILKVQETRSNLIHFLKKSVGILKVFLSYGIPILEIVLRTKTDQVVEILKMLQTTTRFLHHLCCHSKVTKDTALRAQVPQFRLTLETFIFRVKAMLVANDCSAAFWLGNLRNRDLHGEDILSQNSTSTEGNSVDNNGEEELPPDESEDEDITDVEDNNEGSASEVFD